MCQLSVCQSLKRNQIIKERKINKVKKFNPDVQSLAAGFDYKVKELLELFYLHHINKMGQTLLNFYFHTINIVIHMIGHLWE